jgi:ornithine cyclodeaminase/alanine dehydrogenase-like protein (mu-crystallin family)
VSAVRLLGADDVRALITPADALEAVRGAFVRLARGEATVPEIMDFVFPGGEGHVKGAWLHGDAFWSVKAATGFYGNPARGLPSASGVSLVLSAETGELAAVVMDGGLLTELRTAAAGALAASLLARPELEQVTVVGAGGQARFQVEALLGVRQPRRIVVWARRAEAARACAEELAARFGVDVVAAADLEAAVRSADLVVTVTPAEAPLIRAGWLRPGAHLTAVGSDLPGKQEVEAAVLGAADLVVADHPPVAAVNGELQHALAAGVVRLEDVVALGTLPARTGADQVTVCDLVGIGVQDAAVASLIARRAAERGAGAPLSR